MIKANTGNSLDFVHNLARYATILTPIIGNKGEPTKCYILSLICLKGGNRTQIHILRKK